MKPRKYILTATLSAFLFIWLINLALAPIHKMNELRAMVETDTLYLEKYGRIQGHAELESLLAGQAYREALLELAGKDSIHLVVNLSDSTVNLYIKGVMLHQSKATHIECSRLIERMPALQQAKVFSSPLPVRSQYATIVKEPVVIRHAPKDTLEAALNAWEPDTLIQNPAFLALDLEHGFQIRFEQDLNTGFRDKSTRLAFYSRLRLERTAESLSRLVRFRKQDYHAVVTLELDKDDLRAIYRALPEKAFLVFRR